MAARTDPDTDKRIGTRFGEGGRYEIRKRIGRGGMAEVYKVADILLPDHVFAVKVLSLEDEKGLPEPRRREVAKLRSLFLEEAFAISRVRDSNVVTIFSNGKLADAEQTPYMLMEYLDGTDLHRLLKELARKNELLPIERAAEIILGVCAGVQACHLRGVIHRDLKPANIFLKHDVRGEVVKVLDFSVAKVPASRDQTKTDFVIGTEDYMAPELRDRKPATELSDQYSIGALLYKCLTGDAPRGFFTAPREKRPEIPEALEAALLRAMDVKPERRFATVHELGQAIHPFATSEARARWKHYYATPPIPVQAALTGPIVPRSTLGIPELIPTRVAAYDFKAHERATSLGDESLALPTVVEGHPDGVPLAIESHLSHDDGPPTFDTAPPTDVDAPNSHPISSASASGASGTSAARQPTSNALDPEAVALALPHRYNRRLAFAAGLLLPLLVGGAALLRWKHHGAEPVPATAPAWTRTALQPVTPKVVNPPPAAPAVAEGSKPQGAPPTSAAQHPEPAAALVVRAAPPPSPAAPTAPVTRPHHHKKSTKIQYDDDGLPIIH
jgi:serine/threonine protein kinase